MTDRGRDTPDAGEPVEVEPVDDNAAEEAAVEEIEAELVESDNPWRRTDGIGSEQTAGTAASTTPDAPAAPARRPSWAGVVLVVLLLLAALGVAATWLTWPRLAIIALNQLPQPVPAMLDAGSAVGEQLERLAAQQAALREQVELLDFAGRDAAKQLSALTDEVEALAGQAGSLAAAPDGAATAALLARLEAVEQAAQAAAAEAAAASAALATLRSDLDQRLRTAATAATTGETGAAVQAQIETLARELQNLQDRVANALNEFRVDTEADLRAAVDRSGAALQGELEDLRDSLQALSARVGTPATLADLERTRSELAAAEQRLAALTEAEAAARERLAALDERLATVERQAATPGPDARREALVLATAELRRSVLDGNAYADALETARAVAGDNAELAPLLAALEVHAGDGVATMAALRETFPATARAVLQAAGGDGEGVLESTWQRLGGLVTVRRTGEVPGDSAEAIVARGEARLDAGDLAGAAGELAALSGSAADAAAPWLAEAQARLAAEQAARELQRRAIVAVAAG